jgi:lipid-A-disaccharide synthase
VLLRVLISAAEASSDVHGAALVKALREQLPADEPLELIGIGGPKLQELGLKPIVDTRELLAMGFTEILGRLPRIFRAINEVVHEVRRFGPHVVILLDYPDFHFRLAKKLSPLGIPLVYYIPPKVWAWRKHRVFFLKKFFTKVLCILPFEKEFYSHYGVSAQYVGNPLVDELPLDLSKKEAREKLGLSLKERVLILMPGSRPSELKRHLELMLDAARKSVSGLQEKRVLEKDQKLIVLVPFSHTSELEGLRQRVENWKQAQKIPLNIEIRLSQGNAGECLVAADAGLIKSGTSTLEAGLLRCPHVVVYKPSQTTAWIFRYLIRYRGPVGLVNLVSGWRPGHEYLAREILCEEVTVESLKQEILNLMTDTEVRRRLADGFSKLRDIVMGEGQRLSPSVIAAQEIVQLIRPVTK